MAIMINSRNFFLTESLNAMQLLPLLLPDSHVKATSEQVMRFYNVS